MVRLNVSAQRGSACRSKQGSALMISLFFVFFASAVAGTFVMYSAYDASATRRMIDGKKARIAAEAALDYGMVKLKEQVMYHHLSLDRADMQSLLDSVTPPPDAGGYDYANVHGVATFSIQVESDKVTGTITQGMQVVGQQGDYQTYTVTAGARNPITGVRAAAQQQFQAVGLPLMRFGVFYDEDLEINPGANMTFAGPVHSNQKIYLSPSSVNLLFTDRLTAHSDILRYRKDDLSHSDYVGVYNSNDVEVAMNIDSTDPSWLVDSLNLWGGRVMSGVHGVQSLNPPIKSTDQPHQIIEQALATNDSNYHLQTETEKYANKAVLRIRVTTGGVFQAIDSRGIDVSWRFTNAVLNVSGTNYGFPVFAKSGDGRYQFVSNGAYTISNTNFFDSREGVRMRPVDIFVDQLTNEFPQVADATYSIPEGRGLVYITCDDPDGLSNGVMPCVRLRNGTSLPSGGLSFASDLPVYIEGPYNVSNRQPSFVAGDAVTLLSVNWQDANSQTGLSARAAQDTRFNAVIMTGNSETTPGHYNGGLENVLRFLENWTGKTATFRGSIVDLWYAETATAPWISPGTYYNPPTRDWGYDDIYRTEVPPGITQVFGLEETRWTEMAWAETGW